MKTLGQVEELIHLYGVNWASGKNTQAEEYQNELFASLDAWDAVVREAVPGLQAELEGASHASITCAGSWGRKRYE